MVQIKKQLFKIRNDVKTLCNRINLPIVVYIGNVIETIVQRNFHVNKQWEKIQIFNKDKMWKILYFILTNTLILVLLSIENVLRKWRLCSNKSHCLH